MMGKTKEADPLECFSYGLVYTSQKLNAEQIPTYNPIHMVGHESPGDFSFVPLTL